MSDSLIEESATCITCKTTENLGDMHKIILPC